VIEPSTYVGIRNGVCAVGYLTEPLVEYNQNLDADLFQVLGTGFLVERELVVTNRHVIGALYEARVTEVVPESQLFIQFVAPREDGSVRVVPRMIREVSYVENPKQDIGFIRFVTHDEGHFEAIEPLAIVADWNLRVSEEVGVCGYPYGSQLLSRDYFVRWGPVLQQGHISAVSPVDTTMLPDEILLDVRTAPGMSGSPIFRPESGEVIGIHYAGIEATTALGVPITTWVLEAARANAADHQETLNGE
jgi:S1-C subfamily serine protease